MSSFRCLAFILLFLLSCTGEKKGTTHFTGNTMTIDYKIIIGKSLNVTDEKMIRSIIQNTFSEVNSIYNKWNPESEISQLNRLHALEKRRLSPQLEKLLLITDNIVKMTEGRFDPTIEALQQLWKQSLVNQSIPSQSSVEDILSNIGWNRIHIEDGFFWKDHDNIALDLGGVAKGYAVDLITERMLQAGFPDVYVEWGGEIRAAGKHPENRPWTIYISRLEDMDPSHAISRVALSDNAIATSGDYLQFWRVNKDDKEVVYFHIINPITGYPLESHEGSIASTSVLAPTCALADGLATALMLFESEDEALTWAEKLKEEHPSLQFWLLTRSESIEIAL